MAKYEIMLIIDPKADIDNTDKMTKDIFEKDLVSFKKMDINELAYPIHKQTRAQYALIEVKTEDTDKIKEFKRRALISKDVWRELIINIDTEVGLLKKPKKFRGRPPREFKPRDSNSRYSNSRYSNSRDSNYRDSRSPRSPREFSTNRETKKDE